MRGAAVFVLLIAGLLFFGCACPAPEGNGQNATTGGAGAQTGGTGTTETGGTGTETSGAETGGTGTETGGTTETSGTDYSNKDFEALALLGVPLKCDVTTTVDSTTTNVKLYMKGETEFRAESTASSGECAEFVWIRKGDKFYMGCKGQALFGDCMWLESDVETSGTTGSAGTSTPDLTDVPPTDINCAPWVYDASKFTVSGKTCSMEDLTSGYPSDYE